MSNEAELSEREREILRLAATGASNKEIAQELFISTNTVKVHLRNVFAKIGVASRTEAAIYAIREGIAPQPAGAMLDSPVDYAVLKGEAPAAEAVLVTETPRPGFNRRISAILVILLLVAAVSLTLSILREPPPAAATLSPTPQPTLSRWQERAPLPEARAGLAAAVYENQIYAIAGETKDGVSGAVTRYDPINDQWTSLAAKPLPVADVGAALLGEKIYVPGGRLSSGKISDTLEVYDPRKDTWETRSPLPRPVSAYSLAAFEGRLYLFGGTDGTAVLNVVYEYDPSTDVWVERTAMPTGRSFSGAAVAGGKIYVIGGWDGEKALAVNEAYYPERDGSGEAPWENKNALPEARSGIGLVVLAENLYLFGGEGDSQANPAHVLTYVTSEDHWQAIDSQPSHGGSYPGVSTIGGKMYLLGGSSGGGLAAEVRSYQAIYTLVIPVIQDQ